MAQLLKSYLGQQWIGPNIEEDLKFAGIESPSPLRVGGNLVSAARSFRITNPFWRNPKPEAESVVLAWIERASLITAYKAPNGGYEFHNASRPDLLDNSPMYSYVSQPMGGDYLLGWNKKASKVSKQGVLTALGRSGCLAPVVELGSKPSEA
jgi:hypothetical protein